MTDPTNAADILGSQQGDMSAFARLVRGHFSYAYALALRLVCNEEEAEEVAQEAFVRVWKSLNRFDPNTRFTTWLYRIVTNLSLDTIRSRKRRPMAASLPLEDSLTEAPGGMENPESFTGSRDMVRLIERLAGELPETQRMVFTLRDIQDLSIEEVCECTGLSSGSVRSNLHYARKRLREHLEKEYDVKRRGR